MIKQKKDVNLRNYCTIKIGGNAKILYEVDDLQSLEQVCLKCIAHNIKYKVIGNGSNLIFDDRGYDGSIIVNKASKITKRNCSLYISSGTRISSIISYSLKHGLSGLENFAGIPATLGGAIVNNMGAFNSDISNLIDYVVCIDTNTNKKIKLKNIDCNFKYRDSIFKTGRYIIMSAKLNLQTDNSTNIKQRICEAIKHKTSTQPLNYLSAGSVFKRGDLIPAKLIDEFGFKGHFLGGVMVSNKHAGFIVNFNNGTSEEFKMLASRIKQAIDSYYHTNLEYEVEFVPYK